MSAHKRRFLEEDVIMIARLTEGRNNVPKGPQGHPWIVLAPYRDQCRADGINEDFTLPLINDECPFRGKGWVERASKWNVADGYINWKGSGRAPHDDNDPLIVAYQRDNAKKGLASREALAKARSQAQMA